MPDQSKIRNFCIIAHIDHGKSTLSDRLLEYTKTVEKRKMRDQLLDSMDLERERGITIKLQPARMEYIPARTIAEKTQTDADSDLLYSDITYKIRGAAFNVRKKIGLGHKEIIYQNAIEEELISAGLKFQREKVIDIFYNNKKIGVYRPDFIIEDKIIVELKALPYIGKGEEQQIWTYLKGSNYKLLLLLNFSSNDVEIKRIVFDTARDAGQRESASSPRNSAFILNLIDTPGHIDFNYEVSRSLAAVEGAILLVDATQGVQAQTLGNLYLAMEQDLVIIPVVNKIDLPAARVAETKAEIVALLGCKEEDILIASGKTGAGVPEIIKKIIDLVPPPKGDKNKPPRALIFDSKYDDYKGVIAFVRVVDGSFEFGNRARMIMTKTESEITEIGFFKPQLIAGKRLECGEIGYIATGLKDIESCRVGDTITIADSGDVSALPGYKEVKPMVFAGLFPKEGHDFEHLREAMMKLKLSDAALSFEPERSEALGLGFRCGFLGLLHLEIAKERLKREYNMDLVITTPSVAYKVFLTSGDEIIIKSAMDLPDQSRISKIEEPWVKSDIISPKEHIGGIMQLVMEKRGEYKNTEYLTSGQMERVILHFELPLSAILVDFYDKLKSASSGYASLNYEFLEYREADIVRLEILVAEDPVGALSSLVYRDEAYRVGRKIVESLKDAIPRQMFEIKLQAALGAKIIASERIPAMRKDVIAKLYGGDVTRKRKLLEKQKKGKKKMKAEGRGRVEIPSEAFLAVLKK